MSDQDDISTRHGGIYSGISELQNLLAAYLTHQSGATVTAHPTFSIKGQRGFELSTEPDKDTYLHEKKPSFSVISMTIKDSYRDGKQAHHVELRHAGRHNDFIAIQEPKHAGGWHGTHPTLELERIADKLGLAAHLKGIAAEKVGARKFADDDPHRNKEDTFQKRRW